jgi:CobQ-like glutamine amidotransferase family enzyme
MNIYGDRGNILALARRCRARDLAVVVTALGVGQTLDPDEHDIVFIGGAQDRDQRRVAEDLRNTKGPALRDAIDKGVVALAVCGGYQLFGRYYRDAAGAELEGLGVFDLHTEHPGPDKPRLIGNVVADLVDGSGTLVGFENHGGRTHLGPGAEPLARVRSGFGNNGEDRTEGARSGTAFGTYLHGSLLPKNPAFADRLIALALRRAHGDVQLAPLEDRLERMAHAAAERLVGTRR